MSTSSVDTFQDSSKPIWMRVLETILFHSVLAQMECKSRGRDNPILLARRSYLNLANQLSQVIVCARKQHEANSSFLLTQLETWEDLFCFVPFRLVLFAPLFWPILFYSIPFRLVSPFLIYMLLLAEQPYRTQAQNAVQAFHVLHSRLRIFKWLLRNNRKAVKINKTTIVCWKNDHSMLRQPTFNNVNVYKIEWSWLMQISFSPFQIELRKQLV